MWIWFLRLYLLPCITVTSLIYEDTVFPGCGLGPLPIPHESFLLTENEGVRLSCAVCGHCDQTNSSKPAAILKECQPPDLSLPPEEAAPQAGLLASYRAMKKTINITRQHIKKTGKAALRQVRNRDEGDPFENDEDPDTMSMPGVPLFFTQTNLAAGTMTIVKPGPTLFLVQDLLLFRHIRVAHGGLYHCYWNGRKRKAWSLTVWAAGREPYREIYSGKTGPIPQNDQNRHLRDRHLRLANLHIFSRWTTWSQCNVCTIPERRLELNETIWGVQLRAGHCYLRKMVRGQPTRPRNSPDLARFAASGLPCRAHEVPTEIRGLRAVAFRPSELEMRPCWTACQRRHYYKAVFNVSGKMSYEYRYKTGLESKSVFVDYNDGAFIRKENTTDDSGNLIDESDNSSSNPEEHSNYKLRAPRTGDTIFEVGRDNMKVRIVCPFKESVVGGFMWFQLYKKPKMSLNELIKEPFDFMTAFRRSRGRIKFDPGYNVLLSSLLPEDNGKLFVCMHDNKIVGTVYLVYTVKSRFKKIMHTVSQLVMMLMPTVLTVLTLLFVCIILRSKMLKTKKKKKDK